MASSMLPGDRRWASTRKSGMTVLGKVPKPINLPSQRLENHGLDPNVEIVPKGTLTWGGRSSLAAPNAWGTAGISSPNTDGSAGSPSHRPSSGGSGTRPSTPGSDRSHELVSNAWGPSSRPSSASGVLASNQISAAATRPRSAETRPGSSQLSRFADNSVDNTVAWGAAGTAERLGTASSKSSGFTLSSGDFPTLGSDKNSDTHSQRGHSSQGRPQSSQGRPNSSQGRPASASGIDLKPNETLEPHLAGNRNIEHLDRGTVNTWKADNPPYPRHGASPNMENWHRDPHSAPPYPNMNMPPPHYDSWHNPSFRPADGSWYRGGATGGPYRPLGPPGCYPVDYPHVPGRPLSNPQFSRQDAGPGGFYPNNSDSYRPYMPPERYMGPSHSDIPVRPGHFPGPVPYEGYYGPSRPNFYNSTERESSIMGRARPIVHNQHPTQHQNYDSNFHARPSGCATVMNKEQPKPNQAPETQGQYRVLLKQHYASEDRDEQEKRECSVIAGSHLERGNCPGGPSQKGDGETKSQAQEIPVLPNLPGGAVSSQSISGVDGQSTDTAVRNLVADSGKADNEGLVRRLEAANARSRDLQQHPFIKKNATLLEKVESLNNKARIADSHSEGGPISSKGKPTSSKDVTGRSDQSMKVACFSANSSENAVPARNMETANLKELNASAEDRNQESTKDRKVLSASLKSVGATENHFGGQKKVHGVKSADNHAKLRSSKHDNDEWMKKPPGSESSMNTPRTSVKGGALESDASKEAPEKELSIESGVADGSLTTSSLDAVDHKAQRAKMREIAMQRAKQLQMEEEQRTREQKAKALAKLEELNRQTLAESSNLKPNHASPRSSDVQNYKQESGPGATSIADATFVEASSGTSACQPEIIKRVDDSGVKKPAFSSDLSSNALAQASHPSMQSSVVSQPQSLHQGQETNAPTKTTLVTTSDIQHNTISEQKQVGYRKKHGIPQENSMGGKQTSAGSVGSPKDTGEIAVSASIKDTLRNNEDPAVQHKKKNIRNSRNNNSNKLDEGLTSSTLPPHSQMKGNSNKLQVESERTKHSTLVAEATSVPSESLKESVDTLRSREVPDMPVNEVMPETTEETRGRVSNQWRPHPQRKTTRNQQANKPVSKYHAGEAVMWAPVKPSSKSETSDEVSQHSVTEATKPSGKSGQDFQNGLKAKRAEMERYVPKPVAKELSQQVNSQQTSPSPSQAASGDMTGKSETGSTGVESGKLDGPTGGKSAAASDSRNGENHKHNKHGRTNASWRQRSSAESPVRGSMPSDHVKAIQKTSDQLAIPNIGNSRKGQLTHTDDGWNDNDNVLPSEPVTSTVVSKSYGVSRQRRQPYKVQRVSGSNYPPDNIDSQQGVIDKSEHQSPALSHNESEGRNVIRTESQNAGIENIKPHWQPKSQAYGHGRQGNRGTRGGHRGTSQGTENNLTMNEDSNSPNQRTTVAEVREARQQESRRERRVAPDPAKEQTAAELAPPNVGYQHEQAVPLGANQRGQYNGRFQRGYDTTYRGQEGQDTSRQNFHTNGDKRKNIPHVEYQRTGSYDKSSDSFQQNPNAGEGPHQTSRAHGSRYRERGRHYQRDGGQFYGRGAAITAPVGHSYNSGD